MISIFGLELDERTEIEVHYAATVTIAEVTVGDLVFTGEAKLHPKDERHGYADREVGASLALSRAFVIASDFLQQEAQQAIDMMNGPSDGAR